MPAVYIPFWGGKVSFEHLMLSFFTPFGGSRLDYTSLFVFWCTRAGMCAFQASVSVLLGTRAALHTYQSCVCFTNSCGGLRRDPCGLSLWASSDGVARR